MSADNRAVATDALALLGTILDERAARDAIHLAVEPVIAGMDLRPGDSVARFQDGTFGFAANPVGIVDPFLKQFVNKGQRFFLVLFPGQITTLRHIWTHPAFDETPAPPATVREVVIPAKDAPAEYAEVDDDDLGCHRSC